MDALKHQGAFFDDAETLAVAVNNPKALADLRAAWRRDVERANEQPAIMTAAAADLGVEILTRMKLIPAPSPAPEATA